MGFIEKIKIFFNKIFKSNEIKRLDTTKKLGTKIESINKDENIQVNDKRDIFKETLKINFKKKSKKIETLECVGNGLGFKESMKF